MSEQENREVLEGLFSDGKLKLSPEQEHDARAEDYVMEMPQSGERIVGSGGLFIVEARSDYGNEVAFVTDIVECDGDGKIARETRYDAGPFEPPEWRAEWVELMDGRVGADGNRR